MRPSNVIDVDGGHLGFLCKNKPSYYHKNNIENGFLILKLVRKYVLVRLVSLFVQKLIFNTATGGHFKFLALQNSAQICPVGMVAYFIINTLKYSNQPSNFTSQRLVTEPKFFLPYYNKSFKS